MTYQSPDRPEPNEQQPLRARVPEHVSGGAFSTGVIVMTANTEFVLDFVQNLGRPHQIVARVVMPHHVLPQLVDALQRNIDLYRNRWGELPSTGPSGGQSSAAPGGPAPVQSPVAPDPSLGTSSADASAFHSDSAVAKPSSGPSASGSDVAGNTGVGENDGEASGGNSGVTHPPTSGAGSDGVSSQGSSGQGGGPGVRQASAQEIYDDLKIRDELLSGAYANAVMIGHGPHEFSFDFITNFYPHSAVSARVFLAAGQVPRFYESLKGTWEQLRRRMKPPGSDDWQGGGPEGTGH